MINCNIHFLVIDVDGTLTDGKIYMSGKGELFKAFDIKDGYGIKEVLPKLEIVPIIITARKSEILERRCKELDITELYQGEREKLSCLQKVLENWSTRDKREYTLKNVAYIGDDILDLQCMELIKAQGGLVACPVDAMGCVRYMADYICRHAGGNGAVREFIEYLDEQIGSRSL